jgi:hypothetical protein
MTKSKWQTACLLVLFGVPGASAAGLPCVDLKAKIAEGLEAKKVAGYTLTIVPASAAEDGKVVGTCDGGKNKIVYARGGSTSKTAAQPAVVPARTAPPVKK